MSNYIKNSDKQDIYTNVHGKYICISTNEFLFSELLPVILHYIKGGLFGHFVSEKGNVVYISKNELKSIEKFIASISSLKKVKLDGGNIGFEENEEKRIRPIVRKSKQRENKNVVLRSSRR
jgi:hypothetical protein